MPTALFVSPHLDDVAFSCGGTLATLVAAGWECVLVTAFTRSVPNPTGFALACQTDKGLAPEVDYMALRRTEDTAAAAHLGAQVVRWLNLPEAPHRGYESGPTLFAGILPTDGIWQQLTELLVAELKAVRPAVLFAPQGLGNHVDHLHTIRAVRQAAGPLPVLWYRDTPYIIRQPEAVPAAELPPMLQEAAVAVAPAALAAKVAASGAYQTQIDFQFGGAGQVEDKLTQLALREGAASGLGGYAERFLGGRPRQLSWLFHQVEAEMLRGYLR
ncbi:PIG-L family deacetylase [Hymenobacter sp.]|jgi:LmbE family N-acetylglucosaminyl deacetylase|uniref:PIG-L deacetylase family protein n=1 Tax=Hymenobacter sp. TaxID=1898978 RepID=UPI002EDAD370